MRLAATFIALVLLAAAPLAGCGGSSSPGRSGSEAAPRQGGLAAPEGARARTCPGTAGDAEAIRVTAMSCRQGGRLAAAWSRRGGCAPPSGGSRGACTVASYRCLATAADRGLSVGCAKPGRSLAFTVPRRSGG
jgi:hypothetical protein